MNYVSLTPAQVEADQIAMKFAANAVGWRIIGRNDDDQIQSQIRFSDDNCVVCLDDSFILENSKKWFIILNELCVRRTRALESIERAAMG